MITEKFIPHGAQELVADEKFLPQVPKYQHLELDKLLVSQKEAARVLSVSLRTIQNLIARNELPVRRIGRRALIHRRDLETFAREKRVQAGGSS